MGFLAKDNLVYESSIVWLHNPSEFPWVRETQIKFCQRQGMSESRLSQLTNENQIIVGYADLVEDAPPTFTNGEHSYYSRRVFKINRNDFTAYEEGEYPTEAVVPATVKPQVLGISPKRKFQIAVRLPFPLFSRLHRHLQKSSQSLPLVVTDAITQYLDSVEDISLEQRVRELEERVTSLESK